MKTNKPFIKLVKGLSIFLMIIVIFIFGFIMFMSVQRIQQMQISATGSDFYWNLTRQIFIQLEQTWKSIMFCLAFLGGVQILIWLARNRQSFRKLVK